MFKTYLPDFDHSIFFYLYIYLIAGALFLIGFYLYDVICGYDGCYEPGTTIKYYYDGPNDPSTWPDKFLCAAGKRQSPINLMSICAIIIPTETMPPLEFSCEYHQIPDEMKLFNTGHNIVIYPCFKNKMPSVLGGPLTENYSLQNFRFRWGPNDEEGSEHMVDSKKFAMELQAAYIKVSCEHSDMLQAASNGALLIISYLFLTTPLDNPYLEPIITGLDSTKFPLNCVQIEPIPLTLLAPVFTTNYFTYDGSLTFPPCYEGVKWIVQKEPLFVSKRQVRKFRKLRGCCGAILNNVRPVQRMSDRTIFYYD